LTPLFQSASDLFETVEAALDDDFTKAVIERQSPTTVPDSYLRDMRSGQVTQLTHNVDYTPENHALMGQLRAAKVKRIADDYPETEIVGDADADVCVLSWGSTWAAIHAAVQRQRRDGNKLAWIHLTHLNPLPKDFPKDTERVTCTFFYNETPPR